MDKKLGCLWAIFALLLVILLAGGLFFRWYRADIQRAVYEREGVEMTTWEIMMGAKPIERTINIK